MPAQMLKNRAALPMLSMMLPFMTPLSLALSLCVGARAADFSVEDCVKLRLEYEIVGYTKAPPGALKLKEDGQLSQRVWEAFDAEVGSREPTAIKSKPWDRVPQNALVKALIDPQEAAVAQILAIRKAKHDIFIGTYIFGKDAYSLALMKEVKDALARGKNVHILLDSEGTPGLWRHEIKMMHDFPRGNVVDDFGNPTQKPAELTTVLFNPPSNIGKLIPNFFRHLGNLGQEANDGRKVFRLLAHRMHSKILGIDLDYPEGVAFIGGRNKDGNYYGYEKVGPRTYNDTELMIRNDPNDFGPGKKTVATTLGREFRKLYGHLMNKELSGLLFGVRNPIYGHVDRKIEKASADMWAEGGDYDKILKRMESEDFLNTGYDPTEATFLSEIENINRHEIWEEAGPTATPNQTGGRNLISITKELNHLAKKLDGDITIVTPYPNFTPAEKRAMIDSMLANPDKKFTMVTNSLYSGDNIITQYVVDSILVPILKKEAKQAALAKGMGDAQADAFVNRFKIYALGRLDGVEFGGDKFYGKLHAKYAVFKSKDAAPEKTVTVVGSYNGDNISRLHNAEIAVAVKGEGNTHKSFDDKTQQLISMSYEWGSPDWQKVRDSKPLRLKRIAESVVKRIEPLVDPIE